MIEGAGDIDSKAVPESIRSEFGAGIRKLAVNPFDLVYTYDAERDIVFIEASANSPTHRLVAETLALIEHTSDVFAVSSPRHARGMW